MYTVIQHREHPGLAMHSVTLSRNTSGRLHEWTLAEGASRCVRRAGSELHCMRRDLATNMGTSKSQQMPQAAAKRQGHQAGCAPLMWQGCFAGLLHRLMAFSSSLRWAILLHCHHLVEVMTLTAAHLPGPAVTVLYKAWHDTPAVTRIAGIW